MDSPHEHSPFGARPSTAYPEGRMNRYIDRGRGRLCCLLLWTLGFGWGAVALAQEAEELPDREVLQAQYEAQSDPESQEAKWLKEALGHLDAKALAESNRATKRNLIETAPRTEAELRAELKNAPTGAELPDLESDAVQDQTLEDLRARVDELDEAQRVVQDDLDLAKKKLDFLDGEAPTIAERRAQLENAYSQAQQLFVERTTQGAPDAARWAAQTQIARLRAELDANAAYGESFVPERTLAELRRDIAQRKLAVLAEEEAFWSGLLQDRQVVANVQATRTLRQQVDALIDEHPALEIFRSVFETRSELRSGARSVLARVTREEEARQANADLLAEVRERFEYARRREEITGVTEPLGLILLRDYEWLPKPAALRAEARRVEQQHVTAQLDRLEVDEASERRERDGRTAAELFGESPSVDQLEALQEIENLEMQVLKELETKLDSLVDQFDTHRRQVAELERECRAYRDFIEQRILWVRSTAFAPWSMVRDAPVAAASAGVELIEGLSAEGWLRPSGQRGSKLLFGTLATVGLLALRRVLRRKRAEFGAEVRSYRTDRFILTVRAVLQTLLLALPLPLLGWTLGTALGLAPTELLRAAGEGLREIAPAWLVLLFARGMCAQKGLGLAHFRWPALGVRALARELTWFTPIAVGLGWICLTLDRQGNADWSYSLGRCAFIVTMLALALFSRRLLRAESPLWSADSASLLGRTRTLWYAIGQLLPLALAAAAFSGFYYTALEFELRLRWSLGFGFALLLLNALLARWLFMSRRRLAVRQAIDSRAQKEREAAAGSAEAQEAARLTFDAERVDIPDVDAKTRQLFRTSLTLATVIGLYLLWASALPALRALDRIQIWPLTSPPQAVEVLVGSSASSAQTASDSASESTAGGATMSSLPPGSPMSMVASSTSSSADADSSSPLRSVITLADLLLAAFLGLLTLVFSKNLPALLELSLLQRLPLDSGARYAISTIARYLILIVGISATTSAIGIGWQKVQWLAAALTFGLAFGLQEIFANFVSGLILLLERPIRVGDIVTVGSIEGRVTQLRMRATLIQDWDRRELLVPNKEFITSNVINWTLTDPVTRVVIPVGIAYGSDVPLAKKLLLDVAAKNKNVLDDPRPRALFLGFGDSSLNFELRVFLDDRDKWPVLMDSLHSSIDAAFRQAEIEISFPQRDLHLRSVDPHLLEQLRAPREATPAPADSPAPTSDPAHPSQG